MNVYLYKTKSSAIALINKLTLEYDKLHQDNHEPYTALMTSDNDKGFAVHCDEFTRTVTTKECQTLPKDFFKESNGLD